MNYQVIKNFLLVHADQSRQTALDVSTGASSNTSFAGFSNGSYTRLVATASTTLDNGIEVIGVYTMSKDADSGGDNDKGVSVDQNDITFLELLEHSHLETLALLDQ